MKNYVIVLERDGKENAIAATSSTTDLNEAIKNAEKFWGLATKKENFRVKICIVDTDDFIYIKFKGGERNDNGMQSRD